MRRRLLSIFLVCVSGLGLGVLNAEPATATTREHARNAKPYFVEFRARSALSYGHTFLVYGHVGQKIPADHVAGLHPATESSVPWMIGHVVFVPSETGPSDGDTEDQYIIARYRVQLTQAEYAKATAFIRRLQANSPLWHAVFYNCNAFVADVAKSIGLRTPNSTLLMPMEYINALRDLNSGSSELSN